MIKRTIQWALKLLGYRLTSLAPPNCGLDNFFPLLKRFGFEPKHIVDVGANNGNWTRQAIKYFPRAHYTLVEPQDELKLHVRDLVERGYQVHWINAGVSDKPGVLPFQASADSVSSTFRQVTSFTKQFAVQVRTLNEIVSSTGLPVPDMVKIDAEGFDLKVLAGASELLGKTQIFLVEAAVVANDLDNTALAVMETMSGAGYRLIDITDMNRSRKSRVLWLCELAFLLNTSHLFETATSY